MRQFVLLMMCMMLAACAAGIGLAPTPNLYRTGANYPEAQVHLSLRTAEPRIYYVTDREADAGNYSGVRSNSMGFGAATVKFGRDLDWMELLDRTRADSDETVSSQWVTSMDEMSRFNATPLLYQRVDGRLRTVPEVQRNCETQTQVFQDAIAADIRRTGNDRRLLYIHEFNNEFDDAVTALANIWHFSGRTSVPIAFSWFAGNGIGPLGYFRDRDAGTFSVHHTKEFLRMLAAILEVADIDIVAHSRGTDVATTALRELIIEARGSGRHPKTVLKTGTLIVAAPDLDVSIVRQRLQAERFSEAFEQVNLYINPDDAALRLSAFLTGSTRLGALRDEDFIDGEFEALRKQGLTHFIRVEEVRGNFGHANCRDNPAVLSDVVLALCTRAFPGGTLRPLDQVEGGGVWLLHPNYPLDRLPEIDLVEQRRIVRKQR